MSVFIASFILILAGFFQGTFILPMTLVKKWKWENTWFLFSFFGMLVINLIIAFLLFPELLNIYKGSNAVNLLVISLFGIGWGIGAILFGIGMDKLGMSLGYPIIMGLIASLGLLVPFLFFFPEELLSRKGIMLIIGTILIIFGIVLCSRAAIEKTSSDSGNKGKSKTISGIIIAVLAGILSCLPNVGIAFGEPIIRSAQESGIPAYLSGNVVWAWFFTMGFLANFSYTFYLLIKGKNLKLFFVKGSLSNLIKCVLMGIMWIGSFYLYGISSNELGKWGLIIGWPIFISLSIIIGNLWGVWKGEWIGASKKAKRKLNLGLITLVFAMIIIGLSNIN